MKALRLFIGFYKMGIRVNMEYKTAFWLGTIAQVFSYGMDFLLLWVLVSHFQNLAGWSSSEIIFMYSLKLMTYGIAGTFFFNSCTSLPRRIQAGSFDASLIQPIKPLVYEVVSSCNIGYVRHIGLSLCIMIISLHQLQVKMTFVKICMLILFIIGGSLIQSGLFLVFATPSFWLVRGEQIMELFFFEISDFINYPINIYPVIIQALLSFGLPYAFINFYPAQYIFGRDDVITFNNYLQFLALPVGIMVFAFGVCFWHWGLKRYQSTGS